MMRFPVFPACALTLAALTVGCSAPPPPAAPPPAAQPPAPTSRIIRTAPGFDALVPADAKVEKVAGGFQFTEGPLWRPDGTLWFSDLIANTVRSVTPDGAVKVLIENSGGVSTVPGAYAGANGITADKDGNVLMVQHTNRQIVRVSNDLKMTTLLDKFEGKRLNSPNDLVFRSDGALYFTDPPFGLPKQDEDPAKELSFNGVYRYSKGQLTPIIRDLKRPNGLAFSPDEKTLYVSDSDAAHKVVMRYDVAADGTVSNGRVLLDLTAETAAGVPDGLKVDTQGNVYATGPGGVWVVAPDGTRLGTIQFPETPSNCAWGDDGKTLYVTAETSVYRIKLSATGKTGAGK